MVHRMISSGTVRNASILSPFRPIQYCPADGLKIDSNQIFEQNLLGFSKVMPLDVGAAIRASRKLRKLTQTELGEIAGVTRQAVAALEGNQGHLSTMFALFEHTPVTFKGVAAGATVGDKLAMARQAAGLSLTAVARAAGVSINTVRNLERSRGSIGPLVKVAGIVAPRLRAEPVPVERGKVWRTVAGRPNRARDPHDYYATPAPIVRLLLVHEEFDRTSSILEPCVGQARVIETVLRAEGFDDVACSDIAGNGTEQRDFFDIADQHDVVLTNPPFNRHIDWIVNAKRIARHKIALLMPLNYLTGADRHDRVWTDQEFPLARVLVLNRGISFLGDPFAEKLEATQLYCAWYIWDRAHVGPPAIHWIDNHAIMDRQAA